MFRSFFGKRVTLSVATRAISTGSGGHQAPVRAKVFATMDLTKAEWESEKMPRILVTGATGQLSTELVPILRGMVSANNVICTDIRIPSQKDVESGPYYYLDTGDKRSLQKIVCEQRIDYIVHNAALLSVTAEANPDKAFMVNDIGQRNVLDVSSEFGLRLFAPSSIATFGPSAPLDATPNNATQRPLTMYGINKVDLELTGEYFYKRYREETGFDFRSLRLPGVISASQVPGGGTTDWAIEALAAAARGESTYKCWMAKDQKMPFIHIDDAVRAIAQVLFADNESLSHRVYNIHAMSFSPAELEHAIQAQTNSDFKFEYIKDAHRQGIAAGWPRSLDSSEATKDWGWNPECHLEDLVGDMLESMPKSVQPRGISFRRKEGRKPPPVNFEKKKVNNKHAAVTTAAKAAKKSAAAAAKEED